MAQKSSLDKRNYERQNEVSHSSKCKYFQMDPRTTAFRDIPFCVNPLTGQWYSRDGKIIATPPSHVSVNFTQICSLFFDASVPFRLTSSRRKSCPPIPTSTISRRWICRHSGNSPSIRRDDCTTTTLRFAFRSGFHRSKFYRYERNRRATM